MSLRMAARSLSAEMRESIWSCSSSMLFWVSAMTLWMLTSLKSAYIVDSLTDATR